MSRLDEINNIKDKDLKEVLLNLYWSIPRYTYTVTDRDGRMLSAGTEIFRKDSVALKTNESKEEKK